MHPSKKPPPKKENHSVIWKTGKCVAHVWCSRKNLYLINIEAKGRKWNTQAAFLWSLAGLRTHVESLNRQLRKETKPGVYSVPTLGWVNASVMPFSPYLNELFWAFPCSNTSKGTYSSVRQLVCLESPSPGPQTPVETPADPLSAQKPPEPAGTHRAETAP